MTSKLNSVPLIFYRKRDPLSIFIYIFLATIKQITETVHLAVSCFIFYNNSETI